MTTPFTPGLRIDLEGALNLRDLGGWPTLDGRSIRRGVAYRCDRLSQLTARDHETLSQLGIVTVIDFRHQAEVTEDPSLLWPSVRQHVEIPMAGKLAQEKTFLERAFDGELDGIDDDWVFETYVDMLRDHSDGFATAIRHVVDDAPSLFHCTAGKDRTGLMAMLLLSVAGVDRELILEDFELSNTYRAEPRMAALAPIFAERGLNVEDFRPALGAPRPAMVKTLAWLDEHHQGPVGYLRAVAGMTDAELDAVTQLLTGE